MRRILPIVVIVAVAGGAAAWWFLGQRAAEEEAEWADFGDSADIIATAFRGLPGDSFAAGAVANMTRYGEDFALTSFGRMIADPEARRALERIIRDVNEDPLEATQAIAALQGLAELRGLGVRSLAMAAFPIVAAEKDAVGAGAIIACDDPERLADWLDSKLGGEPVSGSEAGLTYACHDSVCRSTRGNTLLVGAPLAALIRLAEDDSALAESGRLQQMLDEAGAVAHGMFGFADLQAVVAAARAAAADDPEAGGDAEAFFDVAGVQALQRATYTHVPAGEGFSSRVDLRFDASASGLLPVLLDFPSAPVTVHRALPRGLETASFGHLDDPAATFDRLLEEIRKILPEEDRMKVDQGMGFLSGLLGIDLRNDVFAALEGELGLAYTRPDVADPQQMLNETRWLLVVGLSDSAKIDGLFERLTPLLQMQGQAIAIESLGDGSLRRLATPMPGGMSPVVAVADGRLVAGSMEEDVRSVYDGGPSLADDPSYQEAMSGMPETASWWGYSKRPMVGVRTTLEMTLAEPNDDPQRQAATYRSLSAIAAAVEGYRFESGDVPRGDAVAAILDALVPVHAAELASEDGWERSFGYASRHDLYVIWSVGSDGERERDWASCLEGCGDLAGTVSTTAADIVVANGEFLRWPAVTAIEAPPPELPAELAAAADVLDAHIARMPPAAMVLRRHEQGLELIVRTPYDAAVMAALASAIGGDGDDEEAP